MSKAFSLLKSTLREVLNEYGFKEATLIQEIAIPAILKGKNVLLISPAGTGKTEAVLLPIFHKILSMNKSERDKGIFAIYITPLRALNRDLFKRIFLWAKKLGISVALRHGDTTQYERRRQTKVPSDILITTPETLQAILPNQKMQRWLKTVKWIIIDEIHSLVSNKRGVQLTLGLERLKELTIKAPQIIGLSATIGDQDIVAKFLVGNNWTCNILDASFMKKYDFIVEFPSIKEEDYELAMELHISPAFAARLRRIKELIETHKKTIVFVNCREFAEIIGSRLSSMGLTIAVHHSSLSKEIREQVEHQLKTGDLQAVVCTSSLELGIDIGNVDLVIQYLSPRQVTALLQRVGRSGHSLLKVSKGIIITGYNEDALEIFNLIKLAKESKIEHPRVLENSLDVLAHQIAGLVLDKRRISIEKIYKIIRRAYPYKTLSFETLTNVVSFLSSLYYVRYDGKFVAISKRTHRYYYEHLTMIPDEIKYPVYHFDTGDEIAYLGEDFFSQHGKPGVVFIMHGRPWKIIEIRGMNVFVRPTDELEAAIPSWEGPIMPLCFESALEMGNLRSKIKKLYESGEITPFILFGSFASEHQSFSVIEKAISPIKAQIDAKLPVADDKTIVLELIDNFLVIHSVFGDAVNRAIACIVYDYLTKKYGQTPIYRTDGYRIMFITSPNINLVDLKNFLLNLKDEEFKKHLEGHIDSYEMRHIALRFGAIPLSMYYKTPEFLRQLPEQFWGTPVYSETLNFVFTTKFDFKNALKIIQKIRHKEIKIDIIGPTSIPSPLALPIIERSGFGQEIISKTETSISLKDTVLQKYVRLICTECGNVWASKINDLDEIVVCSNCKSKFVAPLFWKEEQTIRVVRGFIKGIYFKDSEDEKLWVNAKLSADLTNTYGRKAIMALAVRGVGPATAFPILAKMHRNLDDFFNDLLEAKKTWLRTRDFWDSE